MKREVKKLGAIVLYLVLLCLLLGREAVQLFSLPLMGLAVVGGILLTLPNIEKNMKLQSLKGIFGKNALTAGYMEAFMFLFVRLRQFDAAWEELLSVLALDMRPVFYGFVLYVILSDSDKTGKEASSHSDSAYKGSYCDNESPVMSEEKKQPDFSHLTRREKQVAELLQKGLSNREIGEELYISETTVKRHVSNILEKTGLESRKDLRS